MQSTPTKPSAVAPNSPRAESPTTARPLDFDDEPQEQNAQPSAAATSQQSAQPATEAAPVAPPKPPRPLGPREQSEITLREAFPSVEPSVVKAILTASNWNVERAFNALLGAYDSMQSTRQLLNSDHRHDRPDCARRYGSSPETSPSVPAAYFHYPETNGVRRNVCAPTCRALQFLRTPGTCSWLGERSAVSSA
jgi:hypothetical protein